MLPNTPLYTNTEQCDGEEETAQEKTMAAVKKQRRKVRKESRRFTFSNKPCKQTSKPFTVKHKRWGSDRGFGTELHDSRHQQTRNRVQLRFCKSKRWYSSRTDGQCTEAGVCRTELTEFRTLHTLPGSAQIKTKTACKGGLGPMRSLTVWKQSRLTSGFWIMNCKEILSVGLKSEQPTPTMAPFCPASACVPSLITWGCSLVSDVVTSASWHQRTFINTWEAVKQLLLHACSSRSISNQSV